MIKPKQETDSFKWLFGGALVLVLLIAVGWFLSNYRLVSQGIQYTPNKTNNRYTALSLILNYHQKQTSYTQGTQADRLLDSIWQDADNALHKTVILPRISDNQKTDLNAMLNWVARGGQIITVSRDVLYSQDAQSLEDYLNSENPLLVKLGVYRVNQQLHDKTYEANLLRLYAVPLYLPNNQAIVIENDDTHWFDTKRLTQNYPNVKLFDYDFLVDTKTTQSRKRQLGLTDNQIKQLQDLQALNPHLFDDKRAVVDILFGKGRISILPTSKLFLNPQYSDNDSSTVDEIVQKTDSIFWQKFVTGTSHGNRQVYRDNIASIDNAYLMNYLTDNRQHIYIVDNFETVGLVARLYDKMPFLLVAIGLLALVGVLSLPRQFGAIETIKDDSTHDMMRYFTAVANYLWQQDDMANLVSQNRQKLLDKIALTIPSIINCQDKQQIALQIAQDAKSKDLNLTIHEIYLALFDTWRNDDDFVAMTQAFNRLSACYKIH